MKKSQTLLIVEKPDLQLSSFIRQRFSELQRLLPTSPHKSVAILKHILDQFYKSPKKHHYKEQYWNLEHKDMCKYMLNVGKHKAHRDIHKLCKLVTDEIKI